MISERKRDVFRQCLGGKSSLIKPSAPFLPTGIPVPLGEECRLKVGGLIRDLHPKSGEGLDIVFIQVLIRK